jgi:Xaa-Pro aminopeptidase
VSARLDRLRESFAALGIDALLVTNGVNVRYLCGLQSSNAALLVDAERVLLLTDGRYIEAAGGVPGVDAVEITNEPPNDLRGRLAELARGQVGFEAAAMTVAGHAKLAASGVELVPTERAVERLRAVKDADELDAIRAAAALGDRLFERLAAEPVVGRTEAELAWWIELTFRELGADGLSFPPIVASGPNAARPHHHPGDRRIEQDETLLVDCGCILDGYCSDCTRTFSTGALAPEVEEAYAACLEAQRATLAAVTPGARCAEVDAVARGLVEEAGYTVFHNVGHSLGLEIHEDPRLAKGSTDVLEAGNVVTVEPGVYLAGLAGIRIEDLVIVGADGPEVLTSFPKELSRAG